MKKNCKLLIYITFIIILSNPLYSDQDPYWDFFKEKRKEHYNREITATIDLIFPVNTMKDYVKGGIGPTVSYKYINKNLIYGFDLGFWFFPGDRFIDENENSTVEFMIMVPITATLGYRFNLDYGFSIMPKIYSGPSVDFLSYARGGVPVTGWGDRENELTWGIHLFSGGGFDLIYRWSGNFNLQLGISYGLLVEFGDDTNMIHMARISLGCIFRH